MPPDQIDGRRRPPTKRSWDGGVAPRRAPSLRACPPLCERTGWIWTRFPLCAPTPLSALFGAVGLADVTTTSIVIETRFADFGDYWNPFLGGVGPAGTYVAALGTAERQALAVAVQERLPCDPDGGIALTARAWVVWGRTPSPTDA